MSAAAAASLTSLERISGLIEHYEHCITIGCEALLAMCAPSLLPRNVDLLYALLHPSGRAVLDALARDQYLEPAVKPLLAILAHFSEALRVEERARAVRHAKSGSAGAGEVAAAEGEQPTQVGQFNATDLSNFLGARTALAEGIAIISHTPKHYMTGASQPSATRTAAGISATLRA